MPAECSRAQFFDLFNNLVASFYAESIGSVLQNYVLANHLLSRKIKGLVP